MVAICMDHVARLHRDIFTFFSYYFQGDNPSVTGKRPISWWAPRLTLALVLPKDKPANHILMPSAIRAGQCCVDCLQEFVN